MLSQKHGDYTQRHKLFHTKCTMKGMKLELITNSGSQENITGSNVVLKLQLTIEKHLHPYTIGWIKEVDGIQVKECCKVPFSISKCSDEVYCDIVDMDACNLLFRRPWQFDVDGTHSGRKNSYQLVKEGVCYTLFPMKTNQTKAAKVEGWNFFNITHRFNHFVKECKDTQDIHVMIVKGETMSELVQVNKISMEVQELLTKFHAVLVDDTPNELPPLRDIQIHIYLSPGASLPNLPHYRMSLKENEIVEELLSKVHIQVNMSICAIQTLLMPKKYGSWRVCVESRAINKITIRYRFLIPMLDDMLNQLSWVVMFSKINLMGDYHQIKIRLSDEWKTTFKTRDDYSKFQQIKY